MHSHALAWILLHFITLIPDPPAFPCTPRIYFKHPLALPFVIAQHFNLVNEIIVLIATLRDDFKLHPHLLTYLSKPN